MVKKPLLYRARPCQTICIVRLMLELRDICDAAFGTGRSQFILMNPDGTQLRKDGEVVREFGRRIGCQNWERLTPHGNRKKGISEAASASCDSMHQKSVQEHACHKNIGSQQPYLKPGSKGRGRFFDLLEGRSQGDWNISGMLVSLVAAIICHAFVGKANIYVDNISVALISLSLCVGLFCYLGYGGNAREVLRQLRRENMDLKKERHSFGLFLNEVGLDKEFEEWKEDRIEDDDEEEDYGDVVDDVIGNWLM